MTKYAEAVAAELLDFLTRDPKAILLGVGVGDSRYGGRDIFGTVARCTEKYPERVIDVPLSENMLMGACVGLAVEGWHPVLIHARAEFALLTMSHLFDSAGTWRMIHGTGCPITVRALIGEGWGNGPCHSKAPLEAFGYIPGVDLFTPRTLNGIRRAYNNAALTGNPTVILERRRYYDQPIEEGDALEPAVDWNIPRGPAPASAPLERAYYEGNVVAPVGGPF